MGIPVLWRSVVGYENLYEVSSNGDIRSLYRYKKTLKHSISKNGYHTVELFKDGKGKRLLVHRLVAEAFIPNLDMFPQVNHIDENKNNNSVSNLEWCTAKYNMNYGNGAKLRHSKHDYSNPAYAQTARINGKKTCRAVSQFSKDGILIKTFESGKEAHRQTGINHAHILECCASKKYKTVGGFVWKHAERGVDLLAFQS